LSLHEWERGRALQAEIGFDEAQTGCGVPSWNAGGPLDEVQHHRAVQDQGYLRSIIDTLVR
jgi:hypothetical protein